MVLQCGCRVINCLTLSTVIIRSTNEQYEGALVATVDDIVKKETQAT